VPDSADLSLADVLPSAAAALGMSGFSDSCGLGSASSVVCLLVDGLGFHALQVNVPRWASEARTSSINSVLPTTTAVALTSLGTGMLPGTHGMVGASFLLPDTEEVLAPLHWGSDPLPESVQVEPTVMEALVHAGVRCTSVGPPEYADSGLTRAALRGPRYLGARTIPEYVAAVQESVKVQPCFTYVYWPELDRIGHTVGVEHPEWRVGLARVGELVQALRGALGPNTTLLVTSDHGMVTCPPERRVSWEDIPELGRNVRVIAGEPRCRMVYLEPQCEPAHVADVWRQRLGPDFQVWERGELAASGLLGTAEDFAVERLGDLIVIAASDAMLSVPSVDPRISSLPGQHGAWTDDERHVPLVVIPGS